MSVKACTADTSRQAGCRSSNLHVSVARWFSHRPDHVGGSCLSPACQRGPVWARWLMARRRWSRPHSLRCQLAAGWRYRSGGLWPAAAGTAHGCGFQDGRLQQHRLAPCRRQAADRLQAAGMPWAADCSGPGGSSGHRQRPGRHQPPGWPLPPALTAAPERHRSEGHSTKTQESLKLRNRANP